MRYKKGNKKKPEHRQCFKTTVLYCQYIHSCATYPTVCTS